MTHGQKSFDSRYYRRFFEKYGRKELEIYVNWSRGWFNFLNKYLDLRNQKSKDALEIGCSIGAFSRVLRDAGFRITATDISSYIVGKARKLQKDIEFKTLNIEKESLGKKFDYVFAFEVIEHLRNPEKGFSNIKRMLKNEGTAVISTPFPTKRSLADPTHINVHRPSWWLDLGKKVGFRKTKLIYATFVPFLYRISKHLSIGLPFKTDIPYINSTCFLIFEK